MTAWFCAKGGPTIGVDAGLVATASAGLLVGKPESLGVRKRLVRPSLTESVAVTAAVKPTGEIPTWPETWNQCRV